MATILDGRKISAEIREELKQQAQSLREKGVTPGVAGVLVGERPESVGYLRLKENVAAELGIRMEMLRLAESTAEPDLLGEIERLNADDEIHGIFVQLPLPEHIDENRILGAISPGKDVDGFHPVNVGRAWLGQPVFLPATPMAIHELLVRYGYADLAGKNVVIVNADNLVGKPLASIWAQDRIGANVTLCHPLTPDLVFYTRRADILVVAVNRVKLITADMVGDGVIAIDFGANYVEDPASGRQKLVGDLDFDLVKEKAEAITPVPGGVGPMTVTMLMRSVVAAAGLAGSR